MALIGLCSRLRAFLGCRVSVLTVTAIGDYHQDLQVLPRCPADVNFPGKRTLFQCGSLSPPSVADVMYPSLFLSNSTCSLRVSLSTVVRAARMTDHNASPLGRRALTLNAKAEVGQTEPPYNLGLCQRSRQGWPFWLLCTWPGTGSCPSLCLFTTVQASKAECVL